MIYLITGVPGTGKTLFTLDFVPITFDGRPVYYQNIKGLKLDWQKIEDVNRWYELQHGSVIVIDEAHQVFKKTDGRSSPPPHIEKFDMHRHNGHDVVLISQNGKDLNTFIRNRVGKHYHLHRPITNPDMCKVYIFSKFEPRTDLQPVLDGAEGYDFNYPKRLYDKYESAEVHTVKPYVPKKLWKMIALIVVSVSVIILSGYRLFNRYSHDDEPVQTTVKLDEQQLDSITSRVEKSLDDYLTLHSPRIEGLPHTAPVYDEVTKPESYPKLNCISNETKCWCYSQQSTRIDVPETLCREIVDKGYFDSGLGG